jgi:hypothetical protein
MSKGAALLRQPPTTFKPAQVSNPKHSLPMLRRPPPGDNIGDVGSNRIHPTYACHSEAFFAEESRFWAWTCLACGNRDPSLRSGRVPRRSLPRNLDSLHIGPAV